jgi:ABC-type transporter MlaC component
MLREGDQWRASDVVVEGVSMTSNYSDQFASLLRERSIDELIDLMRRKVEHIADAK